MSHLSGSWQKYCCPGARLAKEVVAAAGSMLVVEECFKLVVVTVKVTLLFH